MGATKNEGIYGFRKLLEMSLQIKLSKEEKIIEARFKIKCIKEFYGHLAAYLVMVPIFIYLNLSQDPNFLWFWFPVLGWGVGLLIHAIKVFKKPFKWEEKKIQEYMNDENF